VDTQGFHLVNTAKFGLNNQAFALVYLEALGFCFVFNAMASIVDDVFVLHI